MFCPSTILVNARGLWIHLDTSADYYSLSVIPPRVWLNPLRYEIGFGGKRNGRRPFIINKGWKWRRVRA